MEDVMISANELMSQIQKQIAFLEEKEKCAKSLDTPNLQNQYHDMATGLKFALSYVNEASLKAVTKTNSAK